MVAHYPENLLFFITNTFQNSLMYKSQNLKSFSWDGKSHPYGLPTHQQITSALKDTHIFGSFCSDRLFRAIFVS